MPKITIITYIKQLEFCENEISLNVRIVFREEFMGPEMIIGEKFPRFGKIFTPGQEKGKKP